MNIPNEIDTGVAVLPGARPSTFTPVAYVIAGGTLGRPLDNIDTGTNTNPAAIANTFDNLSPVLSIASPGY